MNPMSSIGLDGHKLRVRVPSRESEIRSVRAKREFSNASAHTLCETDVETLKIRFASRSDVIRRHRTTHKQIPRGNLRATP